MKTKFHLFNSDGSPKYVRIYDNGGKTTDRYTAVYTGRYRGPSGPNQGWFQYVSMSASPFHPQGVGMHGESQNQIDVNYSGFAPAMGRSNHLGKRIQFSGLPEDCQKLVLQDYGSLWNTCIPKKVNSHAKA